MRGLVSLADSAAFRDPPPTTVSSTVSAPYQVITTEATFEGFIFEPKEAYPITLTFRSTERERRSYDIDVIQRSGTQIIGGIRYVVRTGRAR
jgi:hypothetical protein